MFIIVFLFVSALAAALLLEQKDWEDLVFHEYNIKRWLQHMEVLKQDRGYISSMIDVYTPNKKKAYKEREQNRILKDVSEDLVECLSKGSDYFSTSIFGFEMEYTTMKENREMLLELIKSYGYLEAELTPTEISSFIEIKLGPRSKS